MDEQTHNESPLERAKQFAEGCYYHFREQRSAQVALSCLQELFGSARLPQSITPTYSETVASWHREGRWEEKQSRAVAAEKLKSLGFEPSSRLEAYQLDADRWLEIRDTAFLEIGGSQAAITRYDLAASAYLKAFERLEAEKDRRRREQEKKSEEAKALYVEIYNDLAARYGNLGPQYELLMEQLATHMVRFRQLEIDITSPDYTALVDIQLKLTNQLQRYTEAVKSEVIRPAQQEAIRETLEIVERHFSIAAPHLWRSCVDEIVRRAGGGGLLELAAA